MQAGVRRMNWDAVIAVAEIVGVMAVIASLIYVAMQIRQNTAIARANIVHETSVFFSRFYELLASDAELTDIYRRGLKGDELSENEVIRMESLIEIHTAVLEDLDHQYKSDLYFNEEDDIDLIEYMAPTWRALYTSPVGRNWWDREAPHSLPPSVYSKMNRIMATWDDGDE